MKKTLFLLTSLVLLTFSATAQTTKNIPARGPVLSQDEIIAHLEATIEQVRADW